MTKSHPAERPSLPAMFGLHCAILSLASGIIGLAVAFILWWQGSAREIVRIGEHAGLFSAITGLVLAGIALASPRRRVRVIAMAALFVNLAILSITLDTIFMFLR